MRTTLDLDEELLVNAKEIARHESISLGQVISKLAKQSLVRTASPKVRNGVELFAPVEGAPKSDLRLVNELRDA